MKIITSIEPAEWGMDDYYFIAHLFDQVLLGHKKDSDHDRLLQAIKDGNLLEVHFFNQEQEIFIVRCGQDFCKYNPIKHQIENGITKSYRLEKQFRKKGYENLVVKEYINYDDDLAYVEKRALYDLQKGCR